MQTALKYTTAVLLLVGFLAGCAKDDRVMYQEDPRVYFYMNLRNAQTNPDSAFYTFGIKPLDLQKDTLYLWFRIMGTAVNRDREINVIRVDSSTAKPGYHYDIARAVIPANAYDAQIPVYIYKRPGLKDSIVKLYLTIGESKDFKPGYTDKARPNFAFDRLHYKISITDQLIKPANWDGSLAGNFGVYSKVKFQFMIATTGRVDWTSVFPADMYFLSQSCRVALLEYEMANGPLLDELGNKVVFP